MFAYSPDNQLEDQFSANGTDELPARGFNRSSKRTIAVPVERYLFATQGSYEYMEGHRAFIEGTYASSQSETELEPFALSSADIYPTTSIVPIEFQTPDGVLRNPIVPQAIYDAATDSDSDGYRDLYFRRRLTEVGNRGNVADRDTFRVVGGFEGDIPFGDSWKYEAYYGYGQTKESQVSGGQVNVLNCRSALEAVQDLHDVDGDGDSMEAICIGDIARARVAYPST